MVHFVFTRHAEEFQIFYFLALFANECYVNVNVNVNECLPSDCRVAFMVIP